ncbi:MAG: EamA family transporter, partial [Bacteroidales bacterium]
YIPTGVATTIHFLYPMVVSALMIFIFKEKASPAVLLASILALGGVFLLSGGLEGNVNIKGILLVLITVITYALYIVGVNKSIVSSMDGLKMTFWVLFSAAIVFILNLIIRQERFDMIPDMQIGITLFLLAIIPTLVSDFTLILAVQKIGSTTTAILGCMEPVTAVIVGTLVLHERMETIHLIGVGIILLAVTIVIVKSNKQQNSELITD